MLRVDLRAAEIVGRTVVVAERGSVGQFKRERVREQPEQQLARIALADEISQGLQIDRFQEALIERAGLLRGDAEACLDLGRVPRSRVAENHVAPRGEQWRGDIGPRVTESWDVRPEQERRQSQARRICQRRRDIGDGGEAKRIIVAGAHEIEEDGFVARLRQAAGDRIVSIVDRIDDRAGAERAGKQRPDKQHTPPHCQLPTHLSRHGSLTFCMLIGCPEDLPKTCSSSRREGPRSRPMRNPQRWMPAPFQRRRPWRSPSPWASSSAHRAARFERAGWS